MDIEQLTSLAASRRRTHRTKGELQRALSDYPGGCGISPDQRKILHEEILRRRPDGRWVVTPDPRVVMHGPWRTADLASHVQCPIPFVRGGESRKVSRIDLLRTAMQFPHGRVGEVPGAGHCLVIEDADSSSALLQRFFQDIPLVQAAALPGQPILAGD
jgi:pimeloyl-ACP methyl ester carboxylesterase